MRISVVFQVDAIKDILSCDRRFEEISLRKSKLRMRTKSVKLHYHCLHTLSLSSLIYARQTASNQPCKKKKKSMRRTSRKQFNSRVLSLSSLYYIIQSRAPFFFLKKDN
jgi:hypothetical protein